MRLHYRHQRKMLNVFRFHDSALGAHHLMVESVFLDLSDKDASDPHGLLDTVHHLKLERDFDPAVPLTQNVIAVRYIIHSLDYLN